jgi:REP element-mobilizing transposase RayT
MQPQRRSIRLRGYNYAQQGLYFITLCCHNREHRFGHVKNDQMHCNDFGMAAAAVWSRCLERFELPNHHPLQIMPDHMHAIIELRHHVGATLAVAHDGSAVTHDDHTERAGASPAPTCDWPLLGDVVGAYKSMTVQACLGIYREQQQVLGRFWQRNYYEHIIRDAASYSRICHYIKTNPTRW